MAAGRFGKSRFTVNHLRRRLNSAYGMSLPDIHRRRRAAMTIWRRAR